MFGAEFGMTQPARRTVEMTGAYDGAIAALGHGLMSGTRVASNLGWRAIDALAVGDKVLTFDHGMQEITEVRRAHMWLDAPDTCETMWPVVIPVEALGNREELFLLPDQGVMIESDAAQDMHGDPFAVLTAHSLVGLRGIRRRKPLQRVELIAVYFDHDEAGIRVSVTTSLSGKTGVEMEAMTAVSVALLTIYDMGKALDKSMVIGGIRLIEKTGGKSGTWRAVD